MPYFEEGNAASLYVGYGAGTKDLLGNFTNAYNQGPNMTVTSQRYQVMTCPSDLPADSGQGSFAGGNPSAAYHNYMVNFGNTAVFDGNAGAGTRGSNYTLPTYGGVVAAGAPFAPGGVTVTLTGISDGTSNTLMLAEIIQGHKSASTGNGDLRGLVWWGCAAGFTTYLRPNDSNADGMWGDTSWCNGDNPNPPCLPNTTGWYQAARSRHPGGVHVALCDGSVRFVDNTIDLTTWRALSTSQGGEVFSEY